ncbi:MAG: hypothetical protein WA790_11955 [Sulfitobacter sp.]
MIKMMHILALALIAATTFVASMAAAQTYQCAVVKTSPKSNWIAPQITFRFDGKGGVTVMDSKIQSFGGGTPLQAKARKRPNGKWVITWKMSKIKSITKSRQQLRLYTAEVTPGTLGMIVYAKQAGHSFKVRGTGQCAQRK